MFPKISFQFPFLRIIVYVNGYSMIGPFVVNNMIMKSSLPYFFTWCISKVVDLTSNRTHKSTENSAERLRG